MDLFSQKKMLIRLVIILILLNGLSISAFLWKEFSHKPHDERPENREKKDVASVLKKELDLTVEQFDKIKSLRNGFFEKESVLSSSIRAERDSMNLLMYSKNSNDSLVLSLAKDISDKGYQMEMMRYEQAKALKTICNPEQMEKFEKLVKEIRDYFKPEPQKQK